jgi:hypothetical protein
MAIVSGSAWRLLESVGQIPHDGLKLLHTSLLRSTVLFSPMPTVDLARRIANASGGKESVTKKVKAEPVGSHAGQSAFVPDAQQRECCIRNADMTAAPAHERRAVDAKNSQGFALANASNGVVNQGNGFFGGWVTVAHRAPPKAERAVHPAYFLKSMGDVSCRMLSEIVTSATRNIDRTQTWGLYRKSS